MSSIKFKKLHARYIQRNPDAYYNAQAKIQRCALGGRQCKYLFLYRDMHRTVIRENISVIFQ